MEAGNCSPTHTRVACSKEPQLERVEKEKFKDFYLPSQGLAETPALGHKAGIEALGPPQPLAQALRE